MMEEKYRIINTGRKKGRRGWKERKGKTIKRKEMDEKEIEWRMLKTEYESETNEVSQKKKMEEAHWHAKKKIKLEERRKRRGKRDQVQRTLREKECKKLGER